MNEESFWLLPLCVTLRHRMRSLAQSLLSEQNVEVQSASGQVPLFDHATCSYTGPTPLQLAEGDAPLCDLLIEFGAIGPQTHDI